MRNLWQPIHTAPKDGGQILVLSRDRCVDGYCFTTSIAYWDGDAWQTSAAHYSAMKRGADGPEYIFVKPQYWMHIPYPPPQHAEGD